MNVNSSNSGWTCKSSKSVHHSVINLCQHIIILLIIWNNSMPREFLIFSWIGWERIRVHFPVQLKVSVECIKTTFQAVCDSLFLIFANIVYTGVFHLSQSQVSENTKICSQSNASTIFFLVYASSAISTCLEAPDSQLSDRLNVLLLPHNPSWYSPQLKDAFSGVHNVILSYEILMEMIRITAHEITKWNFSSFP